MKEIDSSQTRRKATSGLAAVPTGVLRRKCASCGNHTVAGGKCKDCKDKDDVLRRKLSNKSEHSEAPPIVHDVLRSSGQPLESATRALMEPHFGYDFSRVRVHTNPKAAQSAHAVDALAYTIGNNVVFGTGQYIPNTRAGQSLLAHELTHVVQSGNFSSASRIKMGRADSPEEKAADLNETMEPPVAENSGVNLLQRKKGGSAGGFFANIFRGVADIFTSKGLAYDEKTLGEYLKYLKDNNDIEDDFDSDNKARAVVWQNLFKAEPINIKILLVQEMLSGATLDDDEQAIIHLLEEAGKEERTRIAETVTYNKLYDKVDGKELDRLYVLLPDMNKFHPRDKDESKEYSFEEYIKKWEKEHGQTLSDAERKVLAHGCIGITELNLGVFTNPDLSNCYGDFESAWNVSRKMNSYLAARFTDRKAIVFSKRFWSGGKDYDPDPKTGKVDMSGYDYAAKPGYTNFDYGFYDEATGKWWHANHCDSNVLEDCKTMDKTGRIVPAGPMTPYESNLRHYSRPLQDFDKQVFCVGVSTRK